MTTYIIWPHDDDAALRAVYEDVVGEALQSEPQNNGTHYIVGSTRITEEHKSILLGHTPSIEFSDTSPV